MRKVIPTLRAAAIIMSEKVREAHYDSRNSESFHSFTLVRVSKTSNGVHR